MSLLDTFLAGHLPAICIDSDGQLTADPPLPPLLLPGSFNPLHEGHLELARAAGQDTAFEVSVINADKPPLPEDEVRRRIAQFVGRGAIWLTRAPTFVEKARLFPGITFVVGADTAARIIDPRFYGASVERMDAAFDEIRGLGSRFLVAPRVDEAGMCIDLDQLKISPHHRPLFVGLSFRCDISSTMLRQGSGKRQ